jgi:hypothetical protein
VKGRHQPLQRSVRGDFEEGKIPPDYATDCRASKLEGIIQDRGRSEISPPANQRKGANLRRKKHRSAETADEKSQILRPSLFCAKTSFGPGVFDKCGGS